MAWIQPIFNRTLADVTALKELIGQINAIGWDNLTLTSKTEWLATSKGAFNFSDLNRIEDNIIYMRDQINALGGTPIVIDTSNPVWGVDDIPFLSNINRIRDNVGVLIDAFYILPTTPTIEYNNPLNWDDANDIEKNLQDMYTILQLTGIQFEYYCGTFSCGQDTIL